MNVSRDDRKIFNFGNNWLSFSENRLDEHSLHTAIQSLKSLTGLDNFKDISFLDVGCGSGLFSIAAHQLGAKKVVGLDVNSTCILASKRNSLHFLIYDGVDFLEGSILDRSYIEKLGHFEIVYAWGSLHHTGSMWEALHNTSLPVSQNGLLVVSIYNKHITSPIWNKIKRIYNLVPKIIQKAMVLFFAGIIFVAKLLVTRHSPLEKQRGMDFWYDLVDWIGGYPYEYASPTDVIRFVEDLGFTQLNFFPAQVPTGCNEFVFVRSKHENPIHH
jgi:2-polyprenyl-3-methyl-5-hydroxy-6-metoxy-1,4-benzoquinol methylase